MQKNISLLDAAKTTGFQTAANAFERIGDAEKTQWLYYYAGLSWPGRVGWIRLLIKTPIRRALNPYAKGIVHRKIRDLFLLIWQQHEK
jgi:hypothetical protein